MLALAWRNLVRNARRSLVTMAAVAIGLSALLFLWGFNDGVHNTMMRNLQEVIVGSLQVHAKGFFHHPKLNRTVPDPGGVETLLRRQGVTRFAPRLRSFALAAGADNSEGLVLLGMDPALEARTTTIASKVSEGRFLASNTEHACVLGATTARNLGLKVGDEVVLLAEDRYGALAADKVKLVGIITSGEMGIDRGLAIVPLGFMQQLLSMGDRVSEIAVRLPESRLETVAQGLRRNLGGDYEVLRWYDMYPMMKQWVELENAFYYIFLSIVLVIVAAGVMNTVLMSMLDRIHEFGIMMALGCGRMRLAAMVVIESMLLGIMGVAAGCALGLGLVHYYHHAGIDLAGEMTTITRFYVDPIIRPEINTDHLLNTVLAVLAAALIAAIWPAWRAARLQPVEAIHHV